MLLALLTTSILLGPAAARVPAGGEEGKARVMILGVYHFDNPGLDYVKTDVVDHLSEAKQAEIAEVLDRLGAFEPTKIVVEATPEAKGVQERYEAFRRDACKLGASEVEQLGFQLARQFDHARIYPADHQIPMDIGSVLQAARDAGDERFLSWFQQSMGEMQALAERQSTLSVRDALVLLNDPALETRALDLYRQLARVGGPGRFVGADVLADWYRRNFCIFSNMARAIESPGERVLVIFGQGHAPYLRELVRSSPDMQLVEPNDYLSP